MTDNWYYDEDEMRRRVAAGDHRDVIGGLWEEVGALQLSWLISRGLSPHHVLLDVGCGSGRLAVRVVPYLEARRYFGIDLSAALLSAARQELTDAGLSERIDGSSFHATAEFEPPPSMPPANFVIAQSVFTHLRLDKFGQCLDRLAPHLAPDARFYATFFFAPESGAFFHERGGKTTFADKDPFHYTPQFVEEMAARYGWRANVIGEWNHPRDQQMVELTLG